MMKEKTKETVKKSTVLKVLFSMALLILIGCTIRKDASAVDRLLLLDELVVYEGDKVNIRDYVDEEFLDENYTGDYDEKKSSYTLTYRWTDGSNNLSIANLNTAGVVSTYSAGEAKVTVTYQYQSIIKSEIILIKILAPEQVTTTYGSTYTLEAAGIYDARRYLYSPAYDSVIANGDGTITVQGFKDTSVYVSGDNNNRIKVADVKITEPSYDANGLVRALGSDAYKPQPNDYQSLEKDKEIQWTITDTNIAVVENDSVKTVAVGTTDMSALLTAKNGDTVTVQSKITVTDPVLSQTELVVASGITTQMSVSGTSEFSVIDWNIGSLDNPYDDEPDVDADDDGVNDYEYDDSESDDKCAYFINEGELYAERAGKATVKIVVDGKVLSCDVTVTDPVYNGSGVIGYKGLKSTVKIQGIDSAKSNVTFLSKNKSIATVSAKGVVKMKKIGNTSVVAVADGRSIIITVEVASVKGYKASKKAIAISNKKTQYSQAKRMSSGYYDCSSLVWRVYSKYGVYFGVKKGWAPVAADIGKWCKNHGKVIANKRLPSVKLLPGDLIFFSYQKNGRYKNISHIEIYTGQDMDVSASSSNNAVIHYPYNNSSSIVMIARPTK